MLYRIIADTAIFVSALKMDFAIFSPPFLENTKQRETLTKTKRISRRLLK